MRHIRGNVLNATTDTTRDSILAMELAKIAEECRDEATPRKIEAKIDHFTMSSDVSTEMSELYKCIHDED